MSTHYELHAVWCKGGVTSGGILRTYSTFDEVINQAIFLEDAWEKNGNAHVLAAIRYVDTEHNRVKP